MRLTLHGDVVAPAVAVLGTWDPLVSTHVELLTRLVEHSAATGATPLALMIDPPPQALIRGAAKWPLFDDTPTRIAELRRHGVAVGHVAFSPGDTGRTADEFFELVCETLPLREFWLRPEQTIGPGATGGLAAIMIATNRRGVQLRRPHAASSRAISGQVREKLAAGAPGAAARLVGRWPGLRRPTGGRAVVAWKSGRYAFARPGDAWSVELGPPPVVEEVELSSADGGLAALDWPDPLLDALYVVRGPGDADSVPIAASASSAVEAPRMMPAPSAI